MTTEEKLKEMALKKYGSLRKFASVMDMSPTTLTMIFQRGIHKTSIQNVIKICQALDISTDELAEDRVIPKEHQQRQALRILAYARELNSVLTLSREYKDSYEPYAIDGRDMTPQETEMFLDGMELVVNLIRKKRVRDDIEKDLNERETES